MTLVALKGLRKTRSTTTEVGVDSVMAISPSPAFLLPAQWYVDPTPWSGPEYCRSRSGSRPSQGDHFCHSRKSSSRAWTRSGDAWTRVLRDSEKSAMA